MQINDFEQAGRLLKNMPEDSRRSIEAAVAEAVCGLGIFGYLSVSSAVPARLLGILEDHFGNLETYLPRYDAERLNAVLNNLFSALMIFANFRVQLYAHSSYMRPSLLSYAEQERLAYMEPGRLSFMKPGRLAYTDPDQFELGSEADNERTGVWLRRTVVIGRLALFLERLRDDGIYGKRYSEMAAELWSAGLVCREREDGSSGLPLSVYLPSVILNRIVDCYTVIPFEKKLRRQIEKKLKNPLASVNLNYPYVSRDAVRLRILALTGAAVLLFTIIFGLLLFARV